MRLAVESWAVSARFGDEEAFRMIKSAGFDAVDYSFYWPKEGCCVLEGDYVARAHQLRACLDGLDLVCHQAHAPFTLEYGDAWDDSCDDYRKIVRSMEFAAILGVKQIIVHSISVPRGVDPMAHNVLFYKSLEPYCAQFDIRIAIENLFDHDAKRRCYVGRIGTAALMEEIIARLDSRHFVLCVDVGHAALTGVEPEDLIAQLNPALLQALHIQDGDYLSDRHTLPYLGQFNWDRIAESLARTGYDGDLTFEIFGFLRSIEAPLLPDALRFAAATGRHLISRIEAHKN